VGSMAGLHPMDTYVLEIRALLGLPVEARIETFADTGQLFLKNAVNANRIARSKSHWIDASAEEGRPATA